MFRKVSQEWMDEKYKRKRNYLCYVGIKIYSHFILTTSYGDAGSP